MLATTRAIPTVKTTIIFPVIIGALIWGGLFLRDERLRALLLQR